MISLISSVNSLGSDLISGSSSKDESRLARERAKEESKINKEIAEVNKYYSDLESRNLLEENLSNISANYGAYNMSSTEGSAKAAKNRAVRDYNNDTAQRQKLFDLNMEKADKQLQFDTEANLLEYDKNSKRNSLNNFENILKEIESHDETLRSQRYRT
ncbi:MAG: hypothetical protein N4A44_00620 [Alphaproteobacteria bacterium]|jgi:hypothetical protein|nr:hypothetical protein [Alphaproteobacteria bacterium]